MGWFPCLECCPRPCEIFVDDFDRGTTTNLGSGWIEAVGDSTLDGVNEYLVMPAGAVVHTTISHPVGDHTGIIQGTMADLQVGDIYRVLIQYDDEEGTFVYGEKEITGGSTAILRVGTGNEGGGENILYELNVGHNGIGTEEILRLCRNTYTAYVDASSSEAVYGCVDPPPNATWKAGLMNAGGTEIEWARFTWREHDVTAAGCGTCFCNCQGFCTPHTLYARITASGYCGGCLNDALIILNWEPARLPEWVWSGTAMLPIRFCDSGNELYEFELICQDGNWGFAGTGSLFQCGNVSPASFQCDPFVYALTGGFCLDTFPGPEILACGWSITITDIAP